MRLDVLPIVIVQASKTPVYVSSESLRKRATVHTMRPWAGQMKKSIDWRTAFLPAAATDVKV